MATTETEKIRELLCVDSCKLESHQTKYSLIHCILSAVSMSYHLEHLNGKDMTKDQIAKSIGKQLYNCFSLEVYNGLMNGQLAQSSKYTFSLLKGSLKSHRTISFGIQEYISDWFDVDIYILYGYKKKIRLDIGGKHHRFYHKGRDSIILFYDGKYFHNVAVQIPNSDSFSVLFSAGGSIVSNMTTQ